MLADLDQVRRIHQQDALPARDLASRRQRHIEQGAHQPQQPGGTVLKTFVPGWGGEHAGAYPHEPAPAAQLLEGA